MCTRSVAFKREHMSVGQVTDVDVIADGGAVGGVVVIAENEDLVAMSKCYLQYKRNEVGFHLAVLANAAVGTGDVKVAQRRRPQAVGLGIGGDHVVDCELGCAIRIRRLRRHRLCDRNLCRLAVRCRGRRKHKIGDSELAHGVEQLQRRDDIVLPIVSRSLNGFANEGARGKMHNAVEASFRQHFTSDIGHVTLDKAGLLWDSFAVAGGKVIDDGDVVPLLHEDGRAHAADIAGTASNK